MRRRDLLALLGTGVASGLSGCEGDNTDTPSENSDTSSDKVETQVWGEWEGDRGDPQFQLTAKPGKTIEELPIHYSSEDVQWARQFALTIQRGANELGVSTTLEDRTNQQVIEGLLANGLPSAMSFLVHSADPARAADPAPLLARRQCGYRTNFGNYCYPELSDVVAESQTATDKDRRKQLIDEAQMKYSRDYGEGTFLFPSLLNVVNQDTFTGYVPVLGNSVALDFFKWTESNLQPKKDRRQFIKGTTSTAFKTNIGWGELGPPEARLKYVIDTLFDLSPDLDTVPALAMSADYIDDTTIEVDLRDNVEWHDGESFGPGDVKFSAELYLENESPTVPAFYETLDPENPVEIVSESNGGKVRFHTKNPDPVFVTSRMVQGAIIPRHRWEDVDNPKEHRPDEPIGTGFFKFDQYSPENRIDLVRNDDHWMWDESYRRDVLGDDFESGPGIDRVTWINFGSIDSMIGSLAQGEIDVISEELSITQAEQAAQPDNAEIKSTESFAPLHTWLNHTLPLFRDKEVRAAWIKNSVNVSGFVEEVLQGFGRRAKGNNFIHPDTPWYNEDVPEFSFDSGKGREILEKAGYTWNDNDNLQYPSGDAWNAFKERIQPENTNKRRDELGQPDFSK